MVRGEYNQYGEPMGARPSVPFAPGLTRFQAGGATPALNAYQAASMPLPTPAGTPSASPAILGGSAPADVSAFRRNSTASVGDAITRGAAGTGIAATTPYGTVSSRPSNTWDSIADTHGKDWQARVIAEHPEIGKAGTAANQAFVASLRDNPSQNPFDLAKGLKNNLPLTDASTAYLGDGQRMPDLSAWPRPVSTPGLPGGPAYNPALTPRQGGENAGAATMMFPKSGRTPGLPGGDAYTPTPYPTVPPTTGEAAGMGVRKALNAVTGTGSNLAAATTDAVGNMASSPFRVGNTLASAASTVGRDFMAGFTGTPTRTPGLPDEESAFPRPKKSATALMTRVRDGY